MSSPLVIHPEDARLLSLMDGELTPEQAANLQSHLASCPECRGRTERLQAALTEYDAYHREYLKPALPPPPGQWADLRERMCEKDAGRVLIQRRPPSRVNLRWAAAAAGVVIAAFLYKTAGERTVSAAELLHQASVRVQPAPERRIQVKTRRARFTRPARASADQAHAELAAWFRQANFSWEDPLNPRSFASWRDGLSEKDDQVSILNGTEFGSGRFYRIRTATSEGNLAEATITLRAADLRAVHESLHFRNNETVEIAEATVETAPPSRLPPPRLAQERPNSELAPVTASDELRVISALHDLGADLGEPVEVRRDQNQIVVTALAASSERQEQIRTVLAGLPFVELRFEEAQPVRSPSTPLRTDLPAGGTSPLQARLAAQLGSRATFENFTNAVLDASESALVRSLALRSLSSRFGPETEAELGVADRQRLNAIQQNHTKRMNASIRQLIQLLQPVTGSFPSSPAAREFQAWQQAAPELAEAAQELDRLLTTGLAGAGSESLETWLDDVRRSASELQAASAGLESVAARGAGK